MDFSEIQTLSEGETGYDNADKSGDKDDDKGDKPFKPKWVVHSKAPINQQKPAKQTHTPAIDDDEPILSV
jgi:hypothetical protein